MDNLSLPARFRRIFLAADKVGLNSVTLLHDKETESHEDIKAYLFPDLKLIDTRKIN